MEGWSKASALLLHLYLLDEPCRVAAYNGHERHIVRHYAAGPYIPRRPKEY